MSDKLQFVVCWKPRQTAVYRTSSMRYDKLFLNNDMTPAIENLNEYFTRRTEEVNHWLDVFLPQESVPPETIHQAMRYSIFAGGKRLRPILVLASGEALGA